MEHEHSYEQYHQPGLQHQFEDMKQQEESNSIGMWMFLAQEIMFFGGLFTVYLVFRSRYPMAFAAGSNHLDVVMGFVNTLVLIVSSLTMALGVYFATKGNRNMQVLMIILTMCFGTVFLGVKYVEYSDKYEHGYVPVNGWNKKIKEGEHTGEASRLKLPFETGASAAAEEGKPAAEAHHANPKGNFQIGDAEYELVDKAIEKGTLTNSERIGYLSGGKLDADGNYTGGQLNREKFQGKVRIFFWIYFTMTGLHALHMIVGLGIMTWLLIMAWRGTFSAEYYAPVEISGLYWHFVDIVWIFLFPLLYLLGRHFLAGGH
ncbi:MAG: cytochrome c oxidase subunit 3 [Pyrinomonadaceae bacterium]